MAAKKQRTLGIIGGMSWESTESYYRWWCSKKYADIRHSHN